MIIQKCCKRIPFFCSTVFITKDFLVNRFHLFLVIAGSMVLLLCSGCEFFSSEQERAGINPKPFNSQSYWEYQPMGGRVIQ